MTTYYVDNSSASASDKNSGKSEGSPFASLAALSKISLQPGDTVAIKAGTVYNVNAAGGAALSLTASGTAANPITITSYGTGDKPIINNTSTQMYSDGIHLGNSHYIDINGISFNSASQAAINVDAKSSNIVVENSEMTGVGEGVLLKGSNSKITNNYMHDLHMVKNTPTDRTSAATIAATNDDDYGANGVVIAGSNNEMSYNKIVNAKAPSCDYGDDGGAFEIYGGVSNISIHDNYASGSSGFLEAGSSGKNTISNVNISNNVSYDNGNFIDMHNRGGNFASTYSNVTVNHNTVVDDNNSSKEMANVFYDGPATVSQIAFQNNIVSLNAGDSVFKQEGTYHSDNFIYIASKATHLYNDWNNTLGTGEVYGNPGLSQAASGGFTSMVPGGPEKFGAVISSQLQDVISGTTITSKNALSSVEVGTSTSSVVTPTIPSTVVSGTSPGTSTSSSKASTSPSTTSPSTVLSGASTSPGAISTSPSTVPTGISTSPSSPSHTASTSPATIVSSPPAGGSASTGTTSTSVSKPSNATTIGSGLDKLVLKLSEDAYKGDAQYTVSIDGKQIGGTLTAHSSHAAKADDTLTVNGSWAAGTHAVSLCFVNDLYDHSSSKDRNLYVDGATMDGKAIDHTQFALMSAGSRVFHFNHS